MGKEKKVTLMPNSFFYGLGSPNLNENYVRVAICKSLSDVKAVCATLRKIKP